MVEWELVKPYAKTAGIVIGSALMGSAAGKLLVSPKEESNGKEPSNRVVEKRLEVTTTPGVNEPKEVYIRVASEDGTTYEISADTVDELLEHLAEKKLGYIKSRKFSKVSG